MCLNVYIFYSMCPQIIHNFIIHRSVVRYRMRPVNLLALTPLDIKNPIFTARVRSTREGNVYTWECLSTGGGGYLPWPGGGGAPTLQLMGGTYLGLGGTCLGQEGVPPLEGGVPTSIREYLPGWGYPLARTEWGAPLPGRDNRGVLDTRRAVCLLRSRRRTFLLQY